MALVIPRLPRPPPSPTHTRGSCNYASPARPHPTPPVDLVLLAGGVPPPPSHPTADGLATGCPVVRKSQDRWLRHALPRHTGGLAVGSTSGHGPAVPAGLRRVISWPRTPAPRATQEHVRAIPRASDYETRPCGPKSGAPCKINTRKRSHKTRKNCVHFSICACHPCAGAMLIFSVSFQF